MSAAAETEARSTAGFGHLVAWALLSAIDAIVVWLSSPLRSGRLGTRLVQHAYDLGQLLAIGLVTWGAVAMWRRFGPRKSVWGYAALAVVAVALSQWQLYDDLTKGVAGFAPDGYELPFVRALAGVAALGVGLVAWAATRLGRTKARIVVIAAALTVGFVHQMMLPSLYPAVHFFATWTAGIALGCGLAQPVDAWWARRPKRVRYGAAAGLAVASAASIAIPASSRVLTQLLMTPGSIVAPLAAQVAAVYAGHSDSMVLPQWDPWLTPRDHAAAAPATGPRVMPDDAIVIFIVMDAFRADLLTGPVAPQFENLSRIRDKAVEFTHARSPASNTNWTMSAVFSGKYANQLLWVNRRFGKKYERWPHEDQTPRLPEILEPAGVKSAVSTHLSGLERELGLTRGFHEELPTPGRYSGPAVDGLVSWLGARDKSSAWFFYLHLIDAHAPYDQGGKEGTKRERYEREAIAMDKELGRLFAFVEDNPDLARRVLFVITADHGEAFGEHNSTQHGSTAYEETTRVPLMFCAPFLKARKIDTPVSLVDLAPTFLDLFGLPTPGTMMGQTLRPLLEGHDLVMERPIFIDSLGKQSALLFPDGIKLLYRHRGGLVELYDLNVDPQELDNLADSLPDAAKRRATYDRLVKAHGLFEK